ncbi:MAG TPA: hypothetical protein VHM19_20835, partial [Polyangiales bacterium]|nr:hypothetical protein [Polyangiales bacterium]
MALTHAEAAISCWIDNPFVVAARPAEVEAAAEWLLAQGDSWARARLSADDRAGAERTLVALAHAQAVAAAAAGTPLTAAVLVGKPFAALFAELGLSRAPVLNVAAAALRARRALDDMRGVSPFMQRLRAEIWSVSFGASLWHALKLGRVIHDHDLLIVGETGTGK